MQLNSYSAMFGKQQTRAENSDHSDSAHFGNHLVNPNVIQVTSLSLCLASKHVVIALMKWSHGSCQANKRLKITIMNAHMLWKVEFHISDHGTHSCMRCQTWDRCQNKEQSGHPGLESCKNGGWALGIHAVQLEIRKWEVLAKLENGK